MDYSLADVAAAVGNENKDGFGGVGWIILLFIFLLAIGGNGFFGKQGAPDSVTQAEFQNGLYAQTTDRNLSDIKSGLCGVDKDVLTQNAQNRQDMLLGFQNIQGQMSQCCCDLKTAIHSEGEATRALITQNTIQDLRDQLAGYRETLENATQTQNILGTLGRYVSNPPVYTGYAQPYYYGAPGTTII